MKERSKDKTFYEDLVEDVTADYERRREERRDVERQWQLNLNYLSGNQYCEINGVGEIEESEKYYFWQDRNAYNHIAPIIDTRIARLTRIRPIMSVRAAGGDEADLKTAKITTLVLNSTWSRLDFSSAVREATVWSEACGTSFYEITWDGDRGRKIGERDGAPVKEGDVKVEVVPPFGIFPDCMAAEGLEECSSLICARAVPVAEIKRRYGVDTEGGDVSVFSLDGSGEKETVMHDCAVVVERFERPSPERPNGRVTAVAGKTLLFDGELPFINGEDGERDFPFVMQKSVPVAGRFFGASIIERLIPLQRSYNAVKNRKHEFLNRVSTGVFAVEDGSVDTDDLAEEGLCPGKVVVYRRGSRPPVVLGSGSVPADFAYEEDRLESEFVLLSGVSEFSRTSKIGSSISSGTALQLLIEQDDTRLSATAENIRRAVKEAAKHVVRLFRQFAGSARIMRIAGDDGKVETLYFTSSDVSSDDVVFDTENELSYTPAQKKNAVYELIGSGLLTDEDGKTDERTKAKLLEILGFGSIENVRDLTRLHAAKAQEENVKGFSEETPVDEYDDHAVHVEEHTRFLLSSESDEVRADAAKKENALAHLRAHRKMLAGAGE